MAQDIDWEKGAFSNPQGSEPDWESGEFAEPKKPTRSLADWGKDIATTALKGAIGVPEALVGLADIPTGGAVGKFLENDGGSFGFRPKQAKEFLSDQQSEATKAARQEFQQAEGIGGKAVAALSNPSVLATTVGESLPSMFAGGALAKGIGLAAPALAGRAGLAAAGEGAMMAGSQAESIRQQTADGLLTPAQSALAAGTGVAGGLIGAAGARAAKALGIGDVDTMIASGAAQGAREGMGLASRVGRGALSEGVLEELPQSLVETAFGNVALDKPVTEGMDEAAVLGTLSGGLMGGVAGGLSRPAKPSQQMGIDPNAGPLSRAAASAVDSQPVPQPLGASITGTDPADLMGRATDPLAEQITSGRQKSEDLAVTRNSFADRNSEALAGGGLFGSRADPLANMIADQRSSEASTAANIDRAAQNRAPMTATEAGNMLVAAREQGRDFTVAPHPDGGFVVVPRGWVTPQVAEKAEASLMETLGRVAQVEDAPINRAARVSTEPANLNLNTDPVTGYVDNLRSVNTPAARMFVSEFDAGRITRQDVERRMAADRGKTADERIAEAAAQAKKPEDPYSLGNIAQSRPEQAPEPLIEIPRTNKLKEARDARRAADELRGTTGASTVTGGDITPPSVESPVADVRSGGRNDDAGTAQPDANGDAGRAVGSTTQGSAALRPEGWRTTAIKAGKVARSLGLDPKGKRLKEIVAEIDAVDAGSGVAAKPVSREQAIRDAWRKEPRTIGKWTPISVEAEGQKADMLVNQKRAGGDKDGALHVVNIRMGKMLKDMEREPIAYTFRLTADNRLVEEGIPTVATPGQIAAWKGAGFALDDKQANVQNTPSSTAGTEAKASPVEARAPEGGNAASDTGVPAAGEGAGVRSDGVNLSKNPRELNTSAEPVQKTSKNEQVAQADGVKKPNKTEVDRVIKSLSSTAIESAPDDVLESAKAFLESNGYQRIKFVTVDGDERHSVAAAVARSLGKTYTVYRPGAGSETSETITDGLSQLGGDHIFVSSDVDNAPLKVAFHEVYHSLPDSIRKPLNEQLFSYFKPGMKDRFIAENNGDEEEAAAHFADAISTRRDFWESLKSKLGKSEFGRIVNAIIKTFDTVVDKLTQSKDSAFLAEYIADVEAARDALAQAYAEAYQVVKAPAEQVNPEPSKAVQPKAQKPAEDDAFMGVKDDGSKPRKVKLTAEQYEANLSAWANGAPKVLSDKADDYAFKSGQPVLLESFHGTGRGDRVGTKFLKKRATSGPMSFFTSSPELAAGYATGKQDTSLANEDISYADWFKYQPKGQRSPVPLDRAWYFMDEETKRRISERMPDIRTDDDGNIIYEAGGGDIGSYEWNLKQTQRGFDKRGNPLEAAVETWLMSGSLFGEEQDFMKVLKLAGVPVSDITYDNPGETFPFVYKTWVRMNRPLVTSDIPARVEQALKIAAVNDRSRAQASGADMWDKNTRTLREWVKEYFEPSSGDNKYVWTSIPDKVTEVLKAEGFDGIIDWSGKGGGATHPVYIPFEQNQVKSAIGNSGKFDPNKDDILAFGTKESKRQGTPVDRAIMDMAEEGREANEILSFIAKSSKSPYRRQLAQKLLATKSNPAVSIGGDMGSKDGYKNLALYSRKNHEIQLAPEAEYKAEQIFLHEAIHSATLLALDRKTLFGVQMNKLYESVKEQGLSDAYGMKNVGEFVAEAFTNPQFQKALRDYKAPNKEAADMSLWERFVSIVRKILRMEPKEQDALSAALDLGAKVMRENMPLRAARSFRAEDGPAFAGSMNGMPDNQAPGPQGDAQQGATQGNAVTKDRPSMIGKFPVLEKTLAEFEADPDSFVEWLVDAVGDDLAKYAKEGEVVAVGIRSTPSKDELGKNPRHSTQTEGGGMRDTAKHYKLPGTSTIRIAADYDYAGYDQLVEGSRYAFKEIAKYVKLGTGYIAVVAGRNSPANKKGIALDDGELLIEKPKVIAYIRAIQNDQSAPDTDGADDAFFGIADAVEQIKAFDVKEAPKNTWAHYRGMALQALGRRQLVDLYGDEFGTHMHQYDEHVQRMEAEKNETGAEADDLAQRWSKLEERAMVGIGKAALPIGKPKYPGMDRKLAELMHDATLAQMDPDKPMPAGYSKAEYDRLKTRFSTLSPEAKTLYREARDMYVAHYKAVQQAIKDRIERSEMSPSEKKRMMAQLDDKLFKELQGVYFPLARFGQYVIVVKDANGEVKNVTRAETVKEAEQARKELQKAFPAHMGNTVGKVLKQAEFNAGRDAVGKGFMADLMNALDEKGVDDELRDTVAQLYLSSLPDLSWAKHGIHRKGTPGFSQDARRAFAQNAFHGARYLAKLRYSDRLQDELTGMQDYVKAFEGVEEYDSIQGQQVVDEMVKRHEILMNPKSSPVSTALTSFGFLFHMGLSPASAMVNLTQTALVAYPQMGAKWGFGKAGAALTKASEEVVRAKNDLSKSLKGDELAAFDRAVKDGTIDVTMAHDLAGIAQGEDQGVMWKVRPVMRWASAMFHHAEKFNRQATFLAAYRLSKQTNPEKSEDWHYESAKKVTYDGHYDYSAANRPRMMQGNWQRVILLFKAFAQNTIYTLARNAYQSVKAIDPKERAQARKTLGGILAAHAAAAGVLGLPIVGPLLTVASWIGGDDDEPWDAEVAMQNAMAEMIGPKAAEVVARGFSRLTPFDLSGRVALNKLILPDVQEGLEGKEWAESAMAAALGPVAGIGVNMARGAQKITEGDYLRGLEDMMPTALRGPLKALRYANEGAVDKTGIVITDEVSAAGVLGQASGFSPSQVRRDTERRSAIYAYDRALLERRSVLMRMMAEARIQGDEETAAEVQKDIQRFNEKNPTRRITPMNIAQSIRNRRKRIDEAEQGVYLPSKRRDALDAVSF